jgi:hypothetical protein
MSSSPIRRCRPVRVLKMSCVSTPGRRDRHSPPAGPRCPPVCGCVPGRSGLPGVRARVCGTLAFGSPAPALAMLGRQAVGSAGWLRQDAQAGQGQVTGLQGRTAMSCGWCGYGHGHLRPAQGADQARQPGGVVEVTMTAHDRLDAGRVLTQAAQVADTSAGREAGAGQQPPHPDALAGLDQRGKPRWASGTSGTVPSASAGARSTGDCRRIGPATSAWPAPGLASACPPRCRRPSAPTTHRPARAGAPRPSTPRPPAMPRPA